MKFLLLSHILSAITVPTTTTEVTPPPSQLESTSGYMMITPAARAADFQEAYNLLKKEKSAGKVYFQLADGTVISNIIDMTVMKNASLIAFHYQSKEGVKFQVVKVEEIARIDYM